MENANNASHTTTTTTEEKIVTYGPIGKFLKSKTTQAILGGVAVIGAGAYGYARFIATGNPVEAVEAAGSAAAAIHGFMAA